MGFVLTRVYNDFFEPGMRMCMTLSLRRTLVLLDYILSFYRSVDVAWPLPAIPNATRYTPNKDIQYKSATQEKLYSSRKAGYIIYQCS